MSNNSTKKRILVTGFGPFGQHTVNASWVAVQELHKLWGERESEPLYSMQIREIPVEYSYIATSLPHIYDEISPDVCIHVGVSPYSILKLERCGHNHNYRVADVSGKLPDGECCVENGLEVIGTRFDLDSVCSTLALSNEEVEVGISEDAGRYLCDFIYYKSLHLSRCPVIFVHVPPLDQPYSAEELGRALRDIVEALLVEMKKDTSV